jgi:hypothetical protein
MRAFIQLLWLWALALAAVALGACTLLAVEGGSAAVAVDGPGNRVTLTMDGASAQFDVHSERGIGSATVQWLSAPLPTAIILRLHLRGLEGFSLSYGATSIRLAVPGTGAPLQSLVLQENGVNDEQPITPDSPYWLSTTVVGQGAEGYFEVALPAHFFAQGQTQFTIQWVDFYR